MRPKNTTLKLDPLSQRIVAVGIVALIIFLIHQLGCEDKNFSGSVGGTGFSLTESGKQELQYKIEDQKTKITHLNILLDENKSLSREQRDSVLLLRQKMETDLNAAQDLFDDLQQYSDLSENGRINLMRDVLAYLSRDPSKSQNIDYLAIAKSIVFASQTKILNDEISHTNNSFDSLMRLYLAQKEEIQRIKISETTAWDSLNKVNNILNILTQEHSNEIIVKNEEIAKLQEALEMKTKQMNEMGPYRAENSSFESPDCRNKKDHSYIVGCMKSLEYKFTLVNTNPSSITKSEKMKVVFTLPSKEPGKSNVKIKEVTAKIGEQTTVQYNDPDFEYIEGLYSVQLLYSNQETTMPIDKDHLDAKKLLTPPSKIAVIP